MPELPEVETTRKTLLGATGKNIAQVYFSKVAPVETTSKASIKRALLLANLSEISRVGKYLLFQTEAGKALVVHLGMSGQLLFFADNPPPRAKHTHLELIFADGALLRFIDPRRFGTISLANNDSSENPFLARLGPDYLGKLNSQTFIDRCRRHPNIDLKTLTLNQKIATGLGNIYSCEALYLAKLDPRRKVKNTSDAELSTLLKSAKYILKIGIKHCGSSLKDYVDGKGAKGEMQNFLQVYGRDGSSTLNGGEKVIKVVQQGRSTWFSPTVQK